MTEKYRYSPPQVGDPADENGYGKGLNSHVEETDVFGHEENHQVRDSVRSVFETIADPARIDTIQDPIMAAGRCFDDSRDCQQWHALAPVESCRRWDCAWGHLDRVPRRLWDLHQLAADSIQAPASRR